VTPSVTQGSTLPENHAPKAAWRLLSTPPRAPLRHRRV